MTHVRRGKTSPASSESTTVNAYWEPLIFELPSAADGGHPWRRWVDTFLESPQDIVDRDQAPEVSGSSYRAEPRSVVVLIAGLGPGR